MRIRILLVGLLVSLVAAGCDAADEVLGNDDENGENGSQSQVYTLAADDWIPHASEEGSTEVTSSSIRAAAPWTNEAGEFLSGSAWFHTARPYDAGADDNAGAPYTVNFEFRVNEPQPDRVTLWSDDLIYVMLFNHNSPDLTSHVTELRHHDYRAGQSLSAPADTLQMGRWYDVRIEAQPQQRTVQIFVDGTEVASYETLDRDVPHHEAVSQQVGQDVIWLGEPDPHQGTHGDVSWRNLEVTVGS